MFSSLASFSQYRIARDTSDASFNGWCDYVFDNEYTIMPLDSLELYIKTNKHLPGIPSQAEVMDNGIDIAKTNAKLLQKIEKLMLYIIALQQQTDELKK